jgi:hypothetical protein
MRDPWNIESFDSITSLRRTIYLSHANAGVGEVGWSGAGEWRNAIGR